MKEKTLSDDPLLNGVSVESAHTNGITLSAGITLCVVEQDGHSYPVLRFAGQSLGLEERPFHLLWMHAGEILKRPDLGHKKAKPSRHAVNRLLTFFAEHCPSMPLYYLSASGQFRIKPSGQLTVIERVQVEHEGKRYSGKTFCSAFKISEAWFLHNPHTQTPAVMVRLHKSSGENHENSK
jgi:hypothetical protein